MGGSWYPVWRQQLQVVIEKKKNDSGV